MLLHQSAVWLGALSEWMTSPLGLQAAGICCCLA